MAEHDDFVGASAVGNGISVAAAGHASCTGGGAGASGLAIGGAEVQSEMFRSLADHSLEFIGMCDLAFKPFYVNEAGMRMVGLDSLEEACAVKVQDFFFPEDQSYISEEFFPKVLREGRGEVEIRFRHFKTGAALWMIWNVFQVRDARGQVSGYATVSRDITERKQAEEAVRSAALFPEENPFPVLRVDGEGKLLFANRGSAELLKEWQWSVGAPVQDEMRERVRTVLAVGDAEEWEANIGGRTVSFVLMPIKDQGYVNLYGRDVTEQKRAEKALGESEEQFRLLYEKAPLGIARIDSHTGRFLLINAKYCEILQRTEAEALQLDFQMVTHPDDLAPDLENMQRLREGLCRSFQMDKRYLRPDGSIVWVNLTVVPEWAEGQAATAHIAMVADITERKRAEEGLRKSEERQGYLLQLGDALRPLKDPVEVQAAAARVLGEHLGAERVLYFEVRDADYVVERDYARSVPPLRGRFPIAAFGPKLREAYQAGRTVVVKDVQTDASLSPEERPAYAAIQIGAYVGVPLVKGGRLVAGLAAHAKAPREWTAEEVELIEETAERTWAAVGRARAEEALRESEENYRTLFSSIDEGFCVIQMLFDEQGKANDWRFVEVNPALERHNGLVQATGKRIRELTPGMEAKWFEVYGKVALTGQATRFEESSEALNRWFDLYAFRVGEPREHKVAVLFTDITARKRAEAELVQYREELERLVAERTARLQELVGELEHFSYTITHDLKSPLRAMRGFAEMAEQVCGQGEAKPFLEKISTAAERMDRLIADALSYSRSVRQELPLEDVDAGALLRGILDSYPQFQPWKAQIRVEGRLPVVLGNEAGLTQCFSNLLGNAVKFVKPGEKPEIRVWATQRGEWVRIWVEDKGIGVSKEMLPRVFEMFSRGSKEYEGTGIGLALVRKVVQRMGGRVGVESEEGKGSRFWIELGRGEAPAFAEATARHVAAFGETGARQGTVLYVEDEESDAMFMERAFAEKGLGEKLRLVGTGRAAIAYLSGSGEFGDREKYPVPSVVLLDLNLPQMSGFGVLEWIRNHPDYARLPVVVFSSSTREDDRTKARELGADEFMAKPSSGLKFGEVVERLKERWVGRRRV